MKAKDFRALFADLGSLTPAHPVMPGALPALREVPPVMSLP